MLTLRMLLCVCGLAAAGCTRVDAVFLCAEHRQCRIDQVDGRCEPTGYCSFPATDCPSQWRYDPSAAPGLADSCTSASEVDCAAPFTPLAGAVTARCTAEMAPTIDGDLTDWDDAAFTTVIDHATADAAEGTWSTDPAVNDADLSARVAIRWDAANLYLAARITDDQILINPSAVLWQNDAFELLLDGDGDRAGPYGSDDHQLIVRSDGVAGNRRAGVEIALPVGLIAAAAEVSSTQWVLEIAVPFAALGAAPVVPGRVIGIDLVLEDREALTGGVSTSLTWKKIVPAPTGCETTCATSCVPSCSTLHFVPLQLGNG